MKIFTSTYTGVQRPPQTNPDSPAQENRGTQSSGLHVEPSMTPTAPAIVTAAHRRLASWTAEQIANAMAIAERAPSSQEALQALIESETMPDDGRDPYGAACAVLALLGQDRDDPAVLWRYGSRVMADQRQVERGRLGRRKPDALDRLIRQYLEELPDITPAALWRDFCRRAEDGFDSILADRAGDELTYAIEPGGRLIDIGFQAFRKRVQRARGGIHRT